MACQHSVLWCRVASEGATPMSVHIHLKDDGEAWEDEVEEEEPNGDLHVENSPTLTGHATGYDAVPGGPSHCQFFL